MLIHYRIIKVILTSLYFIFYNDYLNSQYNAPRRNRYYIIITLIVYVNHFPEIVYYENVISFLPQQHAYDFVFRRDGRYVV